MSLLSRIRPPWPERGVEVTLWDALRRWSLVVFFKLLYWRYLSPMPSLPALPRWQDRVRRWVIWRFKARGTERWGLRPAQWAYLCAGCQRWIAPVGGEGFTMLCYSDGMGHLAWYHQRCWKDSNVSC